MKYQASCVFHPLDLTKFLAELFMGQFRLQILAAFCCMGATWLPPVFEMLEDIPDLCSIINDLFMDVSVDWELKNLPSLPLTLWLPRDMVVQTGTSGVNLSIYNNNLPAMLERMGRFVCSRGFFCFIYLW